MRRAAALALILGLAAPGAGASTASQELEIPEGHYAPVLTGGMAFPVARSSWLSVIQFGHDWHDPRFRLVDGRWQLVGRHEGNDILAEEGTPIHAVLGGTVEAVGWTFYSGTRVGIRGADGRYWFYAHLSSLADGLTPGGRVETGQVIGAVGNTGYGPPGTEDEFPPHLHLGIRDGDTWVDPYPLMRRLYARSVRVTAGLERRLAEAAREGDEARFRRVAARLYADVQE